MHPELMSSRWYRKLRDHKDQVSLDIQGTWGELKTQHTLNINLPPPKKMTIASMLAPV